MRYNLHYSRAAIGLGFLFAISAASIAGAQEVGGLPLGTHPPRVEVSDLAGRRTTLTPAGARPTLIEFWATWCEYCERLEPQMKQAFARYSHDVQFYAVAVNVNESFARVQRHAKQHGLAYPVVYDSSGAATRAFDVPGTSFVVLTDRHGVVVYTGLGDTQDLMTAISRTLPHPSP